MDIENFTAHELGLIILSNGSVVRNNIGANFATLTTKDSYKLIPLAIGTLNKNRDKDERYVKNKIIDAIHAASAPMQLYYRDIGKTAYSSEHQETITNILIEELCGYDEYNKNFNITSHSYERLVSKGYIVDPVLESALGTTIALLGVVPHGFTKRKEKGEMVYIQVKSLLWEFEWKAHHETTTTTFKLKVAKILEWIKSAFPEEADKIENIDYKGDEAENAKKASSPKGKIRNKRAED